MTATTTYAVRPPRRAAYARLAVVLLLALGGLVSAGAAPTWACSCVGGSTAEQGAASGVRVASVAHGASGTPMATATATAPAGQGMTDGAPTTSSHGGLVLVLALVTGLLAILALARRGRPARERDTE